MLTEKDRAIYGCDAVFIGHWEPTTESMITELRREGIDVRVWGPGWRRSGLPDRGRIVPLTGHEYVKALASAKLCLGLLSKWNRNRCTLRTFEIPAIGGLLFTERTDDHLKYFVEDHEAVYFDTKEEMVDKARYYLEHDDVRQNVALAGHQRCVSSRYTHLDRMRSVMAEITRDSQ